MDWLRRNENYRKGDYWRKNENRRRKNKYEYCRKRKMSEKEESWESVYSDVLRNEKLHLLMKMGNQVYGYYLV